MRVGSLGLALSYIFRINRVNSRNDLYDSTINIVLSIVLLIILVMPIAVYGMVKCVEGVTVMLHLSKYHMCPITTETR